MPTITLKGEKPPSMGFPLGTVLRKRATPGEVGLEIEMEGNKFKKEGLATGWVYHKDGSLRGEDNAEYVLAKPIMFNEVKDYIDRLFAMCKTFGSKMDESNRTSVHVHVNMQRFHMNRFTAFCALYLAVEELLTAWCGDHRVGNLFCLRAKDAPAIVSKLRRFIRSDGRAELSEGLHYANLNANALHKYGSIEIRSMRGVTDPAIILDWVSMIERIYHLSKDFPDPRDVCGMFSSSGPIAFAQEILGDKYYTVRQGIDYTEEQVYNALYDGIRLAQDLCYCRDWDLFKVMDVADDPFGRDPRKVLHQLEVYQLGSMNLNTQTTLASQPSNSSTPSTINTFQVVVEQAPQEPPQIAPAPVAVPVSDDEWWINEVVENAWMENNE